MAGTYTITFLDADRTRAEVAITERPSWFGRLFGRRARVRTAIVVLRSDGDWVFNADGHQVSDGEFWLVSKLNWHRRWNPTELAALPRATALEKPAGDAG